jgi:hypothetical protein
VKPDGVQRRLVGEIVRRFERKGFKLVALKLVQVRAGLGAPMGPGVDLGCGTLAQAAILFRRPPRSCCASTTPSCADAPSIAAWSNT